MYFHEFSKNIYFLDFPRLLSSSQLGWEVYHPPPKVVCRPIKLQEAPIDRGTAQGAFAGLGTCSQRKGAGREVVPGEAQLVEAPRELRGVQLLPRVEQPEQPGREPLRLVGTCAILAGKCNCIYASFLASVTVFMHHF